jgi:hypothetical protein
MTFRITGDTSRETDVACPVFAGAGDCKVLRAPARHLYVAEQSRA